ncbi:Barnase-EndoU-ColicinE5/D-RelE like nuclease [Staphylococcus hominis]|uniref:PBECR4 domain-containing protein n=1 Tax=Staphylococcus hominis TaxID=1290 RepID=UPI00119E3EBE|nr:PBECR4 domain-containing protein [Staphylococcus hominis]MCC3711719.1 PBECR4 domain-containing protein [Staphylococcus hominis]MCI2928320.1 PBECR4 domain-containing protein [Staphylococcus hominis]
MTILEDAANGYQSLINKKIINIYGKKGKEIHITILFKDEHFPHLIGLDKLKDIESTIYKNREKADVHKAIIENKLTDEDIEKSSLLHRSSSDNDNKFYTVNERMKFFPKVVELLFNRNHVFYSFIKLKSGSQINADYLLKYTIEKEKTDDPTYLFLFIKKDAYIDGVYIPISFFPSNNESYFRGMPIYTLLQSKLIYDDREEILYCKPSYN